ncbi:MAG: TonB-dependent receptor, partial [Flavobacterium sp.]
MTAQIKNYLLISLTIAVVFGSKTFAQNNTGTTKITGIVVDENQKPIDYAGVVLMNTKDSSLVSSNLTDPSGRFTFENVVKGTYFVSASMMGYNKIASRMLTINGESIDIVEKLQLTSQSKSLKAVEVVVKKPFIERKMDKLIVNVEGSSISAGNTAMEVLEKAPGVTIDKDDNISMKGKQGVLIMLDGKQTYMSSADVASMLRNMQSNQIETIELITSPSARYDAAGTSGIINIKTKKSKSMGLNGTLTGGTGYGETSKYMGGTTLNFRKNNFNVFGNYNYGNNGRINYLNLNRKVNYLDTATTFEQLTNWDNRRYSNSFKAGADYFINNRHTIGFLVNGYANRNSELSTSLTDRRNNFNESEIISVIGNNKEQFSNTAYNLNYKGTLDTAGKEVSVDLDYSHYTGTHDEIRNNAYNRINLTPRGNLDVKNLSPSIINVSSIKVDYSHPINKSTKMEGGIKASIVKTDNDLLLAKLNNGAWVPDAEYTNHFLYNENIYAAYLNFNKEFKTTGVQLGLRAENTRSEGNSITMNQIVSRKYIEFFPSISLSQKLGKSHELGMSYSRRIDRPGYDDLNPFLNFMDEYTFTKGNPYLNPQFTNSIDLSHTYKGGITTTLNFSHTRNAMTFVTQQDDATQRTYATQVNLDKQQTLGLNIYAPVKVVKWWNINNNMMIFNSKFKSKSAGGDLNSGQTAVNYNMDHSFTISKTFGADLSLQYQSPNQYGIFKMQAQT